jgi:methyl-accepting chemotaxis protein
MGTLNKISQVGKGSRSDQGFPEASQTQDLLALVVKRTFAAVVVGMGLYTLVEYFIDRPVDWVGFLTHHLLHVGIIGIAVWVASVMAISRLVIQPVDHLFLHLKRVASGRLDYLNVEVETSQLGGVVSSVNELVSKLRRIPEEDAVSRALDHIRELRAALRGNLQCSENDFVEVMKLVTKLEGDLLEVVQEHDVGASPFNRNFHQPEP